MAHHLPTESSEHDLDIRIELAEHLTTGAAGRGGFGKVGGNDNLGELPITRRDSGKHRVALGADGQAEAHVLDIAAFEELSILRGQNRANQKFGIWGVGTFGGLD